MPYYRLSIDLLKIDEKAAQAALKKKLREHMKKAVKAFVEAAASRIPVDTGMAKGSLLGVAKAVKAAITINPRKTRTVTIRGKKYTLRNSRQKYYFDPLKGEIKSPQLGSLLTEFDVSEYGFRIHSRIFHFALWETLRQPGWGAFKAGEAAMIEYLQKIDLPNIKEFLIKSSMTVTKNGVMTIQGKQLTVEN